MSSMPERYGQAPTMRMRDGSAARRAHAWILAVTAACGLIAAAVTFAVPSGKNGPSRPLEHPT